MERVIWEWVKGYEGLYQVNTIGQVRSLSRMIIYPNGRKEIRPGKILKVIVNKRNGYCYVNLYKRRKMKGKRVHRLVAEAFIPNPKNLPEVNHEDFDKQNNKKSNLSWCDRITQGSHAATKPGRKWQKHRLGKTGLQNPASKGVIVFNLKGNKVGTYESGCLAAAATNSSQSKISACCLGKRNSHNNLKFSFV